MSVLGNKSVEREYIGPPRLLYEQMRGADLQQNPAIIGFISMKEYLTVNYGEEGKGWAADASRYQTQFKVASTMVEPHHVLPSGTIDVVVYPDGDIYHHQKYR